MDKYGLIRKNYKLYEALKSMTFSDSDRFRPMPYNVIGGKIGGKTACVFCRFTVYFYMKLVTVAILSLLEIGRCVSFRMGAASAILVGEAPNYLQKH